MILGPGGGWGGFFRVRETDASFTGLLPGFQSLGFCCCFILRLGAFLVCLWGRGESARTGTHLAHLLFRVQCRVEGARLHQLLWAEPTSLHPQSPWSSYTNINQGKPQAALTPLKQVHEWAFSARRMWLRRTSVSCPRMSVTWLCGAAPAACVLRGQRKCHSGHRSCWCTDTKGKSAGLVSVCVCIHWYRSNIGIQMYAHACVDVRVCMHTCEFKAELKWAMR